MAGRLRPDLAWRGAFAALGWATLAAQYALMIDGVPPGELGGPTLNFFSYFTILTNLLVALAMTAPLLAGETAMGRLAKSNSPRAAVTMFAVVVGVVYHVLLAATWKPTGLQWWVDQGLHTVMPLAMLIDWLGLTPRTRLSWREPLRWLIFPLAYGAWTLLHGSISGWWPYWFVDVDALGIAGAAVNFAGLLIFFAIVGLAVVAIDRSLAGRDRTRAPA
jgi:hypothetical protein